MADRIRIGIERRKIICAKNEKLRVKIIWLHHNVLIAGHAGW